MTKGDATERELSNTLEDEHDFAAFRSGASGSATQRARPDVIAARAQGRRSRVIAAECKNWDESTGYLKHHEVRDLREFARRAGAEAWVVLRPDRRRSDQDWHCFRLADVFADFPETAGGNYQVSRAQLPGHRLAELAAEDD